MNATVDRAPARRVRNGFSPAPWRGPMVTNAPRAQLGIPIAPVLGFIGARILPWVLGTGAVLVGVNVAGRQIQEKLGVNIGNLPGAAMLGGLALTAFTAGPVLPDSIKFIAPIAGGAAAVGALYMLFSPSAEAATAPGAPPAAPVTGQIPAEQAFRAVTGSFTNPRMYQEVSLSLIGANYPVQLVLSNPSPDPVDLLVELTAVERTYMPWGETGTPQRGLVASRLVRVPARQNRVEDFDAVLVSSKVPLAAHSIELTASKRRVGGAPEETAPLARLTFTAR